MAIPPDPCHLFVYGTLKRSQCREQCWPHPPLRVDTATIQASLYDLGEYPAIIAGTDLVLGEVWELRRKHMEDTLRVLDEIEGYRGCGDDLFVRQIVCCMLEDGRQLAAWAYFYGRREELAEASRITNETMTVRWPREF